MLIRYLRNVDEPDSIAGRAAVMDREHEVSPADERDLPDHLAEQLVREGYAELVAPPDGERG